MRKMPVMSQPELKQKNKWKKDWKQVMIVSMTFQMFL